MTLGWILSVLIIGVVVGALGRLVVPGKQKIAIWLTILVGIVGALVGTVIASVVGVALTSGVIDWIELIIQVVLAAVGVAALSAASAGGKVRKRS